MDNEIDDQRRSHNDLENLAHTIKQVFLNRKSTQLGKRYRPVDRYDREEIWMAAATTCQELQADPGNFVECAFRYNRVIGGPFVQQLTGKAIRAWYKKQTEVPVVEITPTGDKARDGLEHEFLEDVRHALRWGVGTDFMETMLDASLWHIPAYVRCILCPGNEDVVAKFGRAAHAQLSANPKLTAIVLEHKYNLDFMKRFIK